LLSKNVKIKIYRTIILPVVLYGCETWSLILRKDCRLRGFENMVLRIFGPKRDKVTGERRKLHNEELNHVLLVQYCSGDQIENNDISGACSAYGGKKRRIQGSGGET